MEIHSYHGSVDPLWNSTAMMCPSARPLPAVLSAGPSCDIKPAFLLAILGQHGRKAAWRVRQAAAMEGVHSYGKPQLRRLHRSAMEFHGHGGPRQLWNPRAGTNGQWRKVNPSRHFVQACPVSPGTFALYAHFLYNRAIRSPAMAWTQQSFSARFTIFSFGIKNAIGTGSSKSWRRMKNSMVHKRLDLLRV
jgi:hypothetical protein